MRRTLRSFLSTAAMLLLAVALAPVLACSDDDTNNPGSDGGTVSGDALAGKWAVLTVGGDKSSTWVGRLRASGDGDGTLSVTAVRASDDDPPAGTQLTVTYTVGSDRQLTVSPPGSTGKGQVSPDGQLYFAVSPDTITFGLKETTGGSASLLKGEYRLSTVHIKGGSGVTGYYDIAFDGKGGISASPAWKGSGPGPYDWSKYTSYTVADNGKVTIGGADGFVGQVTPGGEVLALAIMDATGASKGMLLGVRNGTATSASTLKGTYASGHFCIDGQQASVGTDTLTSAGDGKMTSGEGAEFPADIKSDGTFTSGSTIAGAITADGGAVTVAYTAIDPTYNDICLMVALRRP